MPKIPHDPATELEIRAEAMRLEAKDYRSHAAGLVERANLLDAAAKNYDKTVKKLRRKAGKAPEPAGCGEPDCPFCNTDVEGIKAMLAERFGIDPDNIQVIRP